MDTYDETFETWNKVSKIYEEKFMNLDLYDETYDFFCTTLQNEKATILEIGCGPGNVTKYLLSQKPSLKIEGIDIAPTMIKLARINNPSASFKVMDIRKLNEINTKFDAIMAGFCLPYLSEVDCTKLINDSSNILSENGILYISFVEGEPAKSGFLSGSSGNRTYFYYHTLENLKTILFKDNFETLKIFKVKYPKEKDFEIHTIVIAKKNATMSI